LLDAAPLLAAKDATALTLAQTAAQA
jgi:hypothetical protein